MGPLIGRTAAASNGPGLCGPDAKRRAPAVKPGPALYPATRPTSQVSGPYRPRYRGKGPLLPESLSRRP